MEGTIATILMFGGNFAPNNWLFCDGSLLPISQYDVLFSLIGTTYGGDGQTTFALPDLRSRIPVGTGNGSGLSPVVLGQAAGQEAVTLTQGQMPQHSHSMNGKASATSSNAGTTNPANALGSTSFNIYTSPNATNVSSLAGINLTIGPAGNNQPFPVVQPYLGINYVICWAGIYPSRS